MRAVFLDRATIDSSISLQSLADEVRELTCYPTTAPADVVERALDAEIIITNKVQLNQATLAALPKLKLICITATGTNNVDLDSAKRLGIRVMNVVGYSTASVAQYIFAFLLNHLHRVDSYLENAQQKPWEQSSTFCQIDFPIHELAGKTLGIYGYGTLGKAVAKIGLAFGMTVIVAERANCLTLRCGRVSLDDCLAQSDIFTIHCPLTEETNNLFDRDRLLSLPKGAILINTARGPIVNSSDLAEVLKSGHLQHAIVDVLEQEPPEKSHPLLQPLENLTLTHHIAWGSIQAQQRLIQAVAENIQHLKHAT
ncbi:D-2-hydroxyacid dehydrogenase [Aliikangiella sp. IMCC44653]